MAVQRARAGDYRWQITRQVPSKNVLTQSSYVDDWTFWANVEELTAKPVKETTGSIIEATQRIYFRGNITSVLNGQDQLIDYNSGWLYLINGIVWDFPSNQTIVLAFRQEWSVATA